MFFLSEHAVDVAPTGQNDFKGCVYHNGADDLLPGGDKLRLGLISSDAE